MASARATITGLDSLADFGNRRKVINQVEQAMEEATEKGERALKEFVATRGTGKTWKFPSFDTGRAGSTPGRIDSGDLQGDARGRVTEVTQSRVTGELGWDENSPFYYRLQELGFQHWITGEDIEGMMALRDAADIAKRSLIADLQNIGEDL